MNNIAFFFDIAAEVSGKLTAYKNYIHATPTQFVCKGETAHHMPRSDLNGGGRCG
jgi:hypothetical protein